MSTDISQGSVATHLRCCGIFYYRFTTNLLLSLSVKEFKNWSVFGKVIGKSIVAPFISGHGVLSLLSSTGKLYLFW